MEQTIPIMKGDKVDSNVDYRDFLPVNMYAIQRELLGATGYMLCYPGLSEFSNDANLGVDRGSVYNDRFGTQFRVSGTKLIEVDEDGNITSLGTISGTGQVEMPYSFNTQCIIADGKMWLYEPIGGLVEVTDVDLGDPIDAIWIDGYYFLTDGEYIYHTRIDSTTDPPTIYEDEIDPLDNATSEFSPDRTIGLGKTRDNKVIVFDRYSIEYFSNVATDNFAFQRIDSRAQKIGLIATHAKVDVNGKYYFLGSRREGSPGIYTIDSGQYTKISTREVDKLLCQCNEEDFEDTRFEARMLHNDIFVIMHFPNITLYFNETIAAAFGVDKAWGELRTGYAYSFSENPIDPDDGESWARMIKDDDLTYRGINGVYDQRNAKWVYGDKRTGILGYLDTTKFSQYDVIQEWILSTPFVNLSRMSIDEIELETLPGFDSDSDAKVAVSVTTDGIVHSYEWWQLYGQKFDYNQKFILRRLKFVHDWVGFKLRGVTDSRMAFSNFKLTYS